jgi:hypothetical protein
MVASGGAMILRDLGERARAEGARAIRGVVEGVRGRFARRPDNGLYVVQGADEHPAGEAVWWSRTDPEADTDAIAVEEPGAVASELAGDAEVAKSLERVAETIDRLAAQLDAHHTERAEHLDAIEFLLREMLLGNTASTRPVVLGGVVDPVAVDDLTPDITLVADGFPLEVDTPVEVRSRFHDRWICGFAVAEAIDGGVGPCRYRLTRRSDGIPLPLLFDAGDVRAAGVSQRQSVAD